MRRKVWLHIFPRIREQHVVNEINWSGCALNVENEGRDRFGEERQSHGMSFVEKQCPATEHICKKAYLDSSARRDSAAARRPWRRRASFASAPGSAKMTCSVCLQMSGSPVAVRSSARNGSILLKVA